MDRITMARRNNEYNALDVLMSAYVNYRNTNIADPIYQGVLTEYESSLNAFLIACRQNGRSMREIEPDTIDVSNLTTYQVDALNAVIAAFEA